MEVHYVTLAKHQLRDLKGKFKCWGTEQAIAVLLRCGSVCSVFRASGRGKAEREGGSCCSGAAAAALRGKEPSLEKGEQKAS